MNIFIIQRTKYLFVLSLAFFPYYPQASNETNTATIIELKNIYTHHCNTVSDINEHIPVLRNLAAECSSVVEIGLRTMVSSWGILQGLSENTLEFRSYTGIDLITPPANTLNDAKRIAESCGISFSFIQANDMHIDISNTDLLFIDSLHTYCHLTYELEKFSPKVLKYIALHDTSAPWGDTNDADYIGDFSEYPAHFNRHKRGLWPAVIDFLARHSEWMLYERRLNNHGFTILKRISK